MGLTQRTLSFLSFTLLLLLISITTMAERVPEKKPDQSSSSSTSSESESAVHIVYVERPQDMEPEAFHIQTLASVLGSEEAAKEALIYSYKTAASGFSAKLTPQQVSLISKLPGVLQVVPSRTLQLHSGPGRLH
ncbi:subtilisin-like protease SBT3.3 [Quercus suber]|uniref:subtilisin-like protease SBT3.3 n=1 Tax=Quercus suber TaxID=58331 RepID=UPI000CE16524|nr:subtilisin-like protease SBT3.3 [Quercus suber]POE86304.1 subtilisin-like protease sbt3.3 [Quercus suber]